MDNFNLKQFLSEGKLHKDEKKLEEAQGGIMLDGNLMMGGDWEAGLEPNEVEFVEQNLLGQKPAQDWLDAHGQLWTMMKEPGGDSDVIESGLIDHVQDGLLSKDEAIKVMSMYWGEGADEEDLEGVADTFNKLKEEETTLNEGGSGTDVDTMQDVGTYVIDTLNDFFDPGQTVTFKVEYNDDMSISVMHDIH